MSKKDRTQKKREQTERIRSYARDISRFVAITELMWRDSLGKSLTDCFIQLSQGYADHATPQALQKFGVETEDEHFVRKFYGERPVGDDRHTLEVNFAHYCEAICSKYQITSLVFPNDETIEEIKADTLTSVLCPTKSSIVEEIEEGIKLDTLISLLHRDDRLPIEDHVKEELLSLLPDSNEPMSIDEKIKLDTLASLLDSDDGIPVEEHIRRALQRLLHLDPDDKLPFKEQIKNSLKPVRLRELDAAGFDYLQRRFLAEFRKQMARCWRPYTGYVTLKSSKNWTPEKTLELIFKGERAYCEELKEQPPPPGEVPTLQITVDMSKVTDWDWERLEWEFKECVKKALASLPTQRVTDNQRALEALTSTCNWETSTCTENELPTLTLTLDCSQVNQRYLERLSKKFKGILRESLASLSEEGNDTQMELDFVRRPFRWDDFKRDLRRYDWHEDHGFSCQYIALLEQYVYQRAEREGYKPLEPFDLPVEHFAFLEQRERDEAMREECELRKPYALSVDHPASLPSLKRRSIQGGNSVERGVKRIRDVLSWQPMQGSPQQPETTISDKELYACPYHPLPKECPDNCEYYKRWKEEFDRKYPDKSSVEKPLLLSRSQGDDADDADDSLLIDLLNYYAGNIADSAEEEASAREVVLKRLASSGSQKVLKDLNLNELYGRGVE